MTTAPFEHIATRHIEALRLDFESYVHTRTGARHFHFACDDTNNAFMAAFATLPEDSTGVAHMLEHTTLCGSRRYPVRDPFFMMLRRSLNTFMNAFTSGDTTAYPFATQNRKDYNNLLAVYLDAVFFPRLDPQDFAQEGWRYEFDDAEQKRLVYKGVVYNEMKGAMSAPPSQLWQAVHSAVFDGTVYRHNSGGDPACIPDLSYAALRDFHARHYHPSNAVLMTYGSFPVTEHQAQIDAFALADFGDSGQRLTVARQPRFPRPRIHETSYAVDDPEDLERGAHAVWAWLLDESADPDMLLECHLLSSILLEHSGSPLRYLLETTPLADAPSELCGLDDSGREMLLLCGVEGCDADDVAQLEREIIAVLEKVAADGVDAATLTGVLDRMEMSQRDIGGDGYPYGLQLMSRALPAAMYGADPVDLLDLDPPLAKLRAKVTEPRYVAKLIERYLIGNPHRVRVVMRPDLDKATRMASAERQRLDRVLATMSDAERAAVRHGTDALQKRQDEPQDESILPKVGLSDVPARTPVIEGRVHDAGGLSTTSYAVGTNGLAEFRVVYPLPNLSREELEHFPLFCDFLADLGAGTEDFATTQARRATVGMLSCYGTARSRVGDLDTVGGRFVVSAKGLQRKAAALLENAFAMLADARFDESSRIADLLAQARVDAESSITDRGHQLAIQAAAAGLSAGGTLDDLWEGPTSIGLIQHLARDAQAQASAIARLVGIFQQIRTKLMSAPVALLVVGEEALIETTLGLAGGYGAKVDIDFRPFDQMARAARGDSAWITNTQVSFCAKAYPVVAEAHPDAPALAALAKYLQDGFLHPAIREKGGAYGAGAQYDPDSGTFRFYSYRDPRLAETLADFDRALTWMQGTPDPQRHEESILGVIRHLDAPRSPAGGAIDAYFNAMDGRDHAFRMAFRDAVLALQPADLVDVANRYLDPRAGTSAVVTHKENEETAVGLGFAINSL